MKSNNQFITFENRNHLVIEKVLIDIDGPVLFVSKDISNDFYLCACINSYELPIEYLVVKTDKKTLLKMIENKITMYEAFKTPIDNMYLKIFKYYGTKSDELMYIDNISDDDLPTEGVYFELDTEKDIREYILKLKNYKEFRLSAKASNKDLKKNVMRSVLKFNTPSIILAFSEKGFNSDKKNVPYSLSSVRPLLNYNKHVRDEKIKTTKSKEVKYV